MEVIVATVGILFGGLSVWGAVAVPAWLRRLILFGA